MFFRSFSNSKQASFQAKFQIDARNSSRRSAGENSRGSLKLIATALVLVLANASTVAAGSRLLEQSYPAPVALEAPVQSALQKKLVYSKAGHNLTAIAEFKIEARVLSSAQYRKGREAKISPIDLALGWGKMASEQLLSQVTVTQSGRFASMRYDQASAVDATDIVHNSSNMHMIPATNAVNSALHKIKKGQVVQIEGYLVNIRHRDGWRWLTSTSRKDSGNGACEILLVKSVKIVG